MQCRRSAACSSPTVSCDRDEGTNNTLEKEHSNTGIHIILIKGCPKSPLPIISTITNIFCVALSVVSAAIFRVASQLTDDNRTIDFNSYQSGDVLGNVEKQRFHWSSSIYCFCRDYFAWTCCFPCSFRTRHRCRRSSNHPMTSSSLR